MEFTKKRIRSHSQDLAWIHQSKSHFKNCTKHPDVAWLQKRLPRPYAMVASKQLKDSAMPQNRLC